MPLLQSSYTPGIKELLRTLNHDNLLGLATTATNSRLMAENTEEAIEIILRYTENLEKFFSYRRITTQVLFEYLHKKKKIAVGGGDTKPELIEKVKKEWEKTWDKNKTKVVVPSNRKVTQDVSRVQARPTSWSQQAMSPPSRQPASTDMNFSLNTTTPMVNTTLNLNLSSPGVHINLEVRQGGSSIRSDIFAQEFCKWFYTMMNRLQPQGASLAGDTFSPDVFMANCCMEMYLHGPQKTDKHSSGQHDTYLLMKGVCTDYNLCFVPHLDTGVHVEMSEHGLVKLFCCGTLHQGDSMVGVFEQEFGLVRCPQGKWKIMMIKINLKQAQSVASLPALPKAAVFDIPS